ncbi:MAG: hypothetical protein KKF41_14470 [Actinobacteria bacterium]|nr:hypothetical protein [Actinomycetota bacterium]MBU1943755.1 hypothetical protein [Actinomycetota bacterium]MBU2688779.1 hypothetical protein [Actinomycetota bacterium]
MDRRERIVAAVALRKPDRVPVVPDFDSYPARHFGITQRELLFDMRKAEAALEAAWRDFGFDGHHLFLGGSGPFVTVGMPMKVRLPGRDGAADDEPMQAMEEEQEGPEVYGEIRRRGFTRVYTRAVRRATPELASPLTAAPYGVSFLRYVLGFRRHITRWEKRGVPCLGGTPPNVLPFDVLSGTRSLVPFSKDLRTCPEEILGALPAVTAFCSRMMVGGVRAFASRYCFIGSARTSATFISPADFERFVLPSLLEITGRVLAAGATPFFHFDSDYTPMLQFFRELPRGKCVLNLDESTDIFEAKEILGDHICLMGNVPASLFTLGTAEEMGDYCERLVREVGEGGGFILSSSCSVPPESKPENVHAMIDSVK